MKDKKAIIIGSGVGGLATSIRLACKGYEVKVYEKNNYVGGKLSAIENNGFKFDAGPSLFTAPQFIEDLFALANEPIEEYFSYKKLPIACKYFYSDGTVVEASTNKNEFAKELKNKLGENENDIVKYLNKVEKLYNNTGNFFINNSLQKFKTYLSKGFTKAFSGVSYKHLTKNLNSFNDNHFNNNKTTQLFNRFATYNGSNPYKASAMLSLISSLEHNDGAYYPKGGMISITQALHQLAIKKGVQFFIDKKVDRIIANDALVKGIVVDGKNEYASLVVSNVDAYFTYNNLLNNFNKSNKITKKERSSSALIFYWGINKNFAELDLHNILFSQDYKKEFESIFKQKVFYKDPTVYINITSKQEENVHAPTGKENWFVMINVPSVTNINWDNAIAELRKIIINKIKTHLKTNIEACIETENILTPLQIESETASYMGSLYGTSSNKKLSAFFRHPNFSNHYKGLYFVGGSVHPGGGIPLCLKSAEIVSKMIV